MGTCQSKNPAVCAVENNDIEALKKILDEGYKLNSPIGTGSTTLFGVAARNGTLETVQLLLDRGANIRYPTVKEDTEGDTVYLSLSNPDKRVAPFLIEHGAVLPKIDSFSLYEMAARMSFGSDFLRLLLLNRVPVGRNDRPHILRAVFEPSFDMDLFKILITLITVELNDIYEILLTYAKNDDPATDNLIKSILDSINIQINLEDEQFLNILIEILKKKLPITLTYLIEKGLDVNSKIRGQQLLFRAGDIEIVKLLLDKGADIKVKNDDGLPLTYKRNTEHVKLFIEKGLSIDEPSTTGNTLLIVASNYGKNEDVKFAVENGANVNHKNNKGISALFYAATEEIATYLIEKGADLTIKTSANEPVVFGVIKNNLKNTFKFLVEEKKLSVKDVTTSNANALHYAGSADSSIVKYLIEQDVDVNLKTKVSGNTPITNTITVENAKLLIDAHANVNERNKEGKGALYYAIEDNNIELIKLLVANGAVAKDIDIKLVDNDEVRKLLKADTTYKGVSQETLNIFKSIIDNPAKYAFCPICLAYAEREKGCLYLLDHICDPRNRHEALYNMYKVDSAGNPLTHIEFCLYCGRKAEKHKHFDKNTNKSTTVRGTVSSTEINPFNPETCAPAGGGIEEKVRRIHGLIAKVCALEAKVGKAESKDVRNELIEEVWKCGDPSYHKVDAKKILETKNFGIECLLKPEKDLPTGLASQPELIDITRPEDQKELTPIKTDDNECAINIGPHEDNRPTYKFRHKQADGSVKTHDPICIPDLQAAIDAARYDGKCKIDPECTSLMYPDELRGLVTNQFYNKYKHFFNKANQPVRGGGAENGEDLMVPIDPNTTTCYVPPRKASARKTYRRKHKKSRKTRRH